MRSAAPLVLLAGLVACGGGGAGPDAGDAGAGGPIALADYATAIKQADCHFQVACGQMPDQATCLQSIFVDESELATVMQEVAAGLVTYDATQAGACIALLDGYPCTQTAGVQQFPLLSRACQLVFVGSTPVGGTCRFSEECVANSSCVRGDACATSCCAGTCTAPAMPLPLQANCSPVAAADVCGVDGYCAPAEPGASAYVCTPRIAVAGAACVDRDACAPPMVCKADDTSASTSFAGHCHQPSPHGATCDPDGAGCEADGDFCSVDSNTCVARLGAGQPCQANGDCKGFERCEPASLTCVAFPRAAEACDASVDEPCLGELLCDPTTRLCTAPTTGTACP
jgi:hypothetical protein